MCEQVRTGVSGAGESPEQLSPSAPGMFLADLRFLVTGLLGRRLRRDALQLAAGPGGRRAGRAGLGESIG